MDITATSVITQATPQVESARAPVTRQAADASLVAPQADAAPETLTQTVQLQQQDARKAPRLAAADERPSVGRVRFETEEGTRVTKFFDTKDILIYQVPPEGVVYLVRMQEESPQDQVETSA